VGLECGCEEDEVPIGEAVGKVELIISAEEEVEVEALSGDCCKVADEAGVRLVVDLAAQLFVFLQDLPPHHSDVAHV
jgi:hypothetical protein